VALISALSSLHHPVSTSNPAAQPFFDVGLRLVYAFDHEEAARSFRRAAPRRQNRDHDAFWVTQQFDSAWQGADVQLEVEDL